MIGNVVKLLSNHKKRCCMEKANPSLKDFTGDYKTYLVWKWGTGVGYSLWFDSQF